MDHYSRKMQFANEKDLGKLYQTIYEEKCNQAWLFPDQLKPVDQEMDDPGQAAVEEDREAMQIV